MANEQFRDYFVSEKGYDALKKLMRSGNELMADLAKCWHERHELELSYAKGLRKNSENMQKLAGRAKGSLVQALSGIATQTNIEGEAHQALGAVLLNKIAIPMKNLAETQLKARKPMEDTLNTKFKAWKDQKEIDNKYRQRQFEKCREIENLYLKMDEIPKTGKNSVKEVSKIEMSLQKLEQELDKTEKKYHEATKQVEISRQFCDIEMCRCCDFMQTMEIDRICETEKFIQTYANSIQSLSETMNHVQQDLSSIQITPQDDIVTEGKQNLQTTETEILLYDIYAETEPNTMSHERRITSLMNWMQMLKQDIEIQRRSKDGIENLQGFCKQNQNFSTGVNTNEIYTNQLRVRLLQCLYEASLYKIEKIYNNLKKLPEPQYEYSDRFAKAYSDKNTPMTCVRIPYKPLAQMSSQTSSPMLHLARSTPILAVQQQPIAPRAPTPPYSAAPSQTPIGWAINDIHSDHSASGPYSSYNRATISACPYPVLPSPAVMMNSTDSVRSHQGSRVKVLHAYDAQHSDELTIRPGEIITLLERRSDQWYKGQIRGNVGLFPGNFVQEI